MKFFANGQEIMPSQLANSHQLVDLVSLTINNQKNGKQGKTLSHHAITTNYKLLSSMSTN